MPRAVDRAVATGCDALQIFTKSAGQWRARELPAAEIDQQNRPKPLLVSTPPKVDVATLKAARLKLELEDKTASLRQASLD